MLPFRVSHGLAGLSAFTCGIVTTGCNFKSMPGNLTFFWKSLKFFETFSYDTFHIGVHYNSDCFFVSPVHHYHDHDPPPQCVQFLCAVLLPGSETVVSPNVVITSGDVFMCLVFIVGHLNFNCAGPCIAWTFHHCIVFGLHYCLHPSGCYHLFLHYCQHTAGCHHLLGPQWTASSSG